MFIVNALSATPAACLQHDKSTHAGRTLSTNVGRSLGILRHLPSKLELLWRTTGDLRTKTFACNLRRDEIARESVHRSSKQRLAADLVPEGAQRSLLKMVDSARSWLGGSRFAGGRAEDAG